MAERRLIDTLRWAYGSSLNRELARDEARISADTAVRAKLELGCFLALIEDLRKTAQQADTEQPPQFYTDHALAIEHENIAQSRAEIAALEDELSNTIP